ncbi:MAG TPA: glycosyltransferase family 39 protein [Solirubrobacteraceae bacterium]|nr:glycosyltransferase family 39 protein [Solirubrobacteraceae bacterium]
MHAGRLRLSRARSVVALVLLGALAVRLALVEATPSYRPVNDARSYGILAAGVDRTGDYPAGSGAAGGTRGPTAYFPPAYPYFLAAVALFDGHRRGGPSSVRPARVAQAVLGTVTVGLAGLVALELFGGVVALAALVLAAAYAPWIVLGGTLMAESLLVAFELGALWAALRARRAGARPWGWVVLAGLLAGLATLTHENAAVLLVPLALALWTGRPRWSRPALLAPLAFLATVLLVLAPWTIRNAVVMHRFIPVADEAGFTLAGTYNRLAAADKRIPYHWHFHSTVTRVQARRLTEPGLGARLQAAALRYIAHHPVAPLAVLYHNTLRLLDLEGSYPWRASYSNIGAGRGLARVGVAWFWLMAALALLGAATGAARRAPRWLWLGPLLLYLSVVFVNAETPRFRAPIDSFVLLLASLAVARLLAGVLRDRLA